MMFARYICIVPIVSSSAKVVQNWQKDTMLRKKLIKYLFVTAEMCTFAAENDKMRTKV
jgi:hypothetical protein